MSEAAGMVTGGMEMTVLRALFPVTIPGEL